MTFLDTNVFVYCVDVREQTKMSIARSIVESAIRSPSFRISVQVLNEFSNVALKKFAMDATEVKEYLEEFSKISICNTDIETTFDALQIQRRYGLQFYDALLLAAASANGCDTILTEDLADGQEYCGVKAVNPFK